MRLIDKRTRHPILVEPGANASPLPERLLNPDVLVIGAGPAGLAAALAAHDAGAQTLLLDDRAPLDAGLPALRALPWGAFPGPEIAATDGKLRWLLRPRQLILTPGAHETPLPLPGWTLPGSMTTGALQSLTRTDRPTGRIVVAGNGPFNLQVAAELVRAGATVTAVIEAAAQPPMLGRARHLQTLRRAGIPILWQTRPIALLGTHRVEALAVEGPAGQQVLPADTVALHWGIQADTGMARALGAAHRVTDGRLQTITDPAGRTSLPGLFAVTDTGRVALHRGRIAGLAAAAALGFHTPHPPYAALRRAERAQRALRHAFATTSPDPAALPDDTILCRCEAVTAGALRAATRAGAASLATLKRATRAGMGPCAGRLCSATIARLTGATTEAGFAAPRLPLRPVPAAALLADHPDPADRVIPAPPPLHWTTAALSTHLGARPDNADIVVIGAGLIGLSTALYLARDGRDVLLLDRGEPGMAASTANAGSLHVQLVPYVYAANGGGPMAHALSLGPASIALWRDLADEAGEDLGIRTEGGLILAETEAEMKLLRSKAAFERCRGIPAQVIGPAELRALAPGLAGIFAGASFCPLEGQGDPLRGTMALLSLAHRAGVRVAGGIEVTGLECAAPGWTVRTAAGPIRAGQVVNTAGVQVMRVGAYAGVAVPGHALVQQVIATAPGPTMLRQLVAWTGRHLSLKQGNGGHILIGGGWPGTLDGNGAAQLDRQSIEGNLALASRALPALRPLNVVRAWTGLAPNQSRPPLISATPGQPGLFHAMTGNGYTLAPVIGRILADAIRTSAPLPPAFAL